MYKNTLNFQETDRLKGILILLVIFGHIEQFFTGENGKLQYLLYSFHVVSFFFLPFLFNKDKVNMLNIQKNLRRLYIPYTVFYIIAVIAYSILMKEFDFFEVIKAWFIGTGPLIKPNAGFAVFWFFPALFSTILLILIYNTLSKSLKQFFILLIILCHFLIPLIPSTYLIYFPFGLYVPLYLFSVGLVIKYLYKHTQWKNYLNFKLLLLFVVLLLFLYGTRFNLASPLLPNILENPFHFLAHDILFVIGFFTMIYISQKIVFFESFGKYSLALFTIHPFVIQLTNRLYNWSSIIDGLIKFIVVVTMTYIIVKVIYVLKIDKIIYPR